MYPIAAFGFLLGAGGVAVGREDGIEGFIVVSGCGACFFVLATAFILSRVTCTPIGLTYWNFVRRHVPRAQIVGVHIGPGSGAYYARIAIWIDRLDGKPIRLTSIQQPKLEVGRRALEAQAAAIATYFGLR